MGDGGGTPGGMPGMGGMGGMPGMGGGGGGGGGMPDMVSTLTEPTPHVESQDVRTAAADSLDRRLVLKHL